MNILKTIALWIVKHVCIVAAVILGLWLWHEYDHYIHSDNNTVASTHTKEVKEIHHWHEVANTQPITNHIQITLDSSFRKQIESGTISTGVKFSPGDMKVQSVTKDGKVSEKDYKIPEGAIGTLIGDTLNIKKAPFLSQLRLYAGLQAGVNQNGLTVVAPQIFITSPTGWALNGSYNIMDNSKCVGISKKISFKRK